MLIDSSQLVVLAFGCRSGELVCHIDYPLLMRAKIARNASVVSMGQILPCIFFVQSTSFYSLYLMKLLLRQPLSFSFVISMCCLGSSSSHAQQLQMETTKPARTRAQCGSRGALRSVVSARHPLAAPASSALRSRRRSKNGTIPAAGKECRTL